MSDNITPEDSSFFNIIDLKTDPEFFDLGSRWVCVQISDIDQIYFKREDVESVRVINYCKGNYIEILLIMSSRHHNHFKLVCPKSIKKELTTEEQEEYLQTKYEEFMEMLKEEDIEIILPEPEQPPSTEEEPEQPPLTEEEEIKKELAISTLYSNYDSSNLISKCVKGCSCFHIFIIFDKSVTFNFDLPDGSDPHGLLGMIDGLGHTLAGKVRANYPLLPTIYTHIDNIKIQKSGSSNISEYNNVETKYTYTIDNLATDGQYTVGRFNLEMEPNENNAYNGEYRDILTKYNHIDLRTTSSEGIAIIDNNNPTKRTSITVPNGASTQNIYLNDLVHKAAHVYTISGSNATSTEYKITSKNAYCDVTFKKHSLIEIDPTTKAKIGTPFPETDITYRHIFPWGEDN